MLSISMLKKVVQLAELDLVASHERVSQELSADCRNQQNLDQSIQVFARDRTFYQRFSLLLQTREKRTTKRK